jgi:hypothetical protein
MKYILILFSGLWFPFITSAFAQFSTTEQLMNQIYGGQTEGCTQVSVTTTGANRSGPLTAGRRYTIYGYNGADISQGDALKCVWGGSGIDVTALGGSLVGETIFANQQRVFQAKTGNLYISCISKTATMKYDICPLK